LVKPGQTRPSVCDEKGTPVPAGGKEKKKPKGWFKGGGLIEHKCRLIDC